MYRYYNFQIIMDKKSNVIEVVQFLKNALDSQVNWDRDYKVYEINAYDIERLLSRMLQDVSGIEKSFCLDYSNTDNKIAHEGIVVTLNERMNSVRNLLFLPHDFDKIEKCSIQFYISQTYWESFYVKERERWIS